MTFAGLRLQLVLGLDSWNRILKSWGSFPWRVRLLNFGAKVRTIKTASLVLLAIACVFPIALMIFNPTLMFERGWEQYLGTSIYFWAVIALGLGIRYGWQAVPAGEYQLGGWSWPLRWIVAAVLFAAGAYMFLWPR